MKILKIPLNLIYAILIPLLVVMPMLVSGQPRWHVQTSPVAEDLVSVSFADTLNGWAVSRAGKVIRTDDGGINWQVKTSLDGFIPEKISFQDDQTGWLAGAYTMALDTGFILTTKNAGATWTRSHFHIASKLYDIFFINDTLGWAVGYEGDTLGLTLYTTDAGQTWTEGGGIYVAGIYTSVHFRDTEEGDICGLGPVMMHTNKGGRGTSPWALELTNLKQHMYDLVNLGEQYGCMVGADGKLWFTQDQWNNFIEADYEQGDTLWSVDAIEPLGFWVVGEAGTILFIGYSLTGLTVDDQSLDIPQDLVDLDAIDDAHAWVVGEEGTILFYGFAPSSGIPNPVADSLQVFPNPATDFVKVINIKEGIDRIELFSMDGKLRHSTLVPGGKSMIRIDLGSLEAGSYVLKAGEDRKVLVILNP
jgi:photosystem II stability/assembly factor-like uncharacterized protein